MNTKLEQHVIIKFLWSEDVDPVEIHHRLLRAFQEDAYVLSNVYEWIRTFKSGSTNLLDDRRAGRPRLDHIDSQILSLFRENEFHSLRRLAQALGISVSTVHSRLTQVLEFWLRQQIQRNAPSTAFARYCT
jgi:transposase